MEGLRSENLRECPHEVGEEQGGDTEVENSSQGRRTSRQPLVYTPSGKEYSKVTIELAKKAVDPNSVEKLIDQVVEYVGRTVCGATANVFGSCVFVYS